MHSHLASPPCPSDRLARGARAAFATFLMVTAAAPASVNALPAVHRLGEAGNSVDDKNERAARARAKAAEAARAARSRSSKSGRSSTRTKAVSTALRYTTPRGELELAADLTTMLRARTKSGMWGVVVTSLSRGDTLFSVNADAQVLPASTLKLYTTALAFDRLGPHHQFTTEILRDGNVGPDGTLRGSIFLRGGGDPALSARFVGGTPDAPMQALARLVAAAGVKHITGDVVGDDGAFDAKRIPDGWLARYLGDSYAARVSALSLNENLLRVAISPSGAGKAPRISLQPATVAYNVVNAAKTSGSGRSSKLTVGRKPDGTIVVRGWIGGRSVPRVYTVVVDDPAIFTAGAFREALQSEGITVGGKLRLGPTPVSAARVGTFNSPPLFSMASVMNRESINHFAELIFRNAARTLEPAGIGSAERGSFLLNDFMTRKVGARPNAVNAADGSGLSSLDRVTARSLVQLLGYANRASWTREFHQSLPVAGESELLRRRMIATPAQGNLHAKTGTTNDVVALGGYVTSRTGELIAFSFIYNGRDRWHARETIDAMGATLAGWSR
jgi:serine-type D-Ala-D-Ala carboxypeptidase/endopeptidase (penicillin-binding protein 4)